MSYKSPLCIESTSLSLAWARAFLHTFDVASRNLKPIVLAVEGVAGQLPSEEPEIRQGVDSALSALNMNSVRVSGITIFPYDMWVRRGRPNCVAFSDFCVDRFLPRMKARDPRNRYGTYFERMMRYTGIRNNSLHPVNQLDFVIGLLKRARRTRYSALQIGCFDPAKDHTGQSVRGFPCLQQVSVALDDDGKLLLNAYYPTQYIFDRGYGNYLGLCHLGQFLAHEVGTEFTRLTCFVGQPALGDVNKSDVQSLANEIRARLEPAVT